MLKPSRFITAEHYRAELRGLDATNVSPIVFVIEAIFHTARIIQRGYSLKFIFTRRLDRRNYSHLKEKGTLTESRRQMSAVP